MIFDLQMELKNIILNTQSLQKTYINIHSHSKYTLDLIIQELLYFLKAGISWRMLRSPIHYKTLYWHYSNFVKFNVFHKLFNKVKRYYINNYISTDESLLIDSTIVYCPIIISTYVT